MGLTEEGTGVERAILREHPRLVRLCAHLTGDADAAEDLAQETLYEALRNAHKVHNPSGCDRWLDAIARNVCLRWARKRARESARLVRFLSEDSTPLTVDDWAADDFDLEVELERDELADLLDRAMALLPPATRQVLIGEYIEGRPRSETAVMLGLSECATEKRLQRGRQALRRVLTTELIREAVPYGLGPSTIDTWQETRIWCTECGRHRLLGHFGGHHTELTLRCPGCCDPGTHVTYGVSDELFRGVRGYKPALTRLSVSVSDYFRRALVAGVARCPGCRHLLPLRPGLQGPVSPALMAVTAVHVRCRGCGFTSDAPLNRLALALPEGRHFWREHPRIRTLPEREIEAEGHQAIVTTFESVSDSARLEVVARRDTFEVLAVHLTASTDSSRAETAAELPP